MNSKNIIKCAQSAFELGERGKYKESMRKFEKAYRAACKLRDERVSGVCATYAWVCSLYGQTLVRIGDEQSIKRALELFELGRNSVTAASEEIYAQLNIHTGMLLVRLGRYDEAISIMELSEKYIVSQPCAPEALRLLTRARMSSDTIYPTELFTDACDKVIALKKNVSASCMMEICMLAAKACYAISNLDRVKRYAAYAFESLFKLTADLLSEDIVDYALSCAQYLCLLPACVKISDNDARVKMYIECADEALLVCEKIKKAVTALQKSRFCTLHIACAAIYLRYDKPDKAISALDSCEQMLFDTSEYVLMCAWCDYRIRTIGKENASAVIEKCQQSVSLCPDNRDVAVMSQIMRGIYSGESIAVDTCADALAHLRDCGCVELAADYAMYIRLNPAREFTAQEKAVLCKVEGNASYSLSLFERAHDCFAELNRQQKLSGENARVLCGSMLDAAYCSIRLDNPKRAQQECDAAIEMLGSDASSNIIWDIALQCSSRSFPSDYCMNLFRLFLEYAERDKEVSVRTAEAHNRIGVCLYKTKADVNEEIAAYERARDILLTLPEGIQSSLMQSVYSNLGECYERTGNNHSAIVAYNKAIAIMEAHRENGMPIDFLQSASIYNSLASVHLKRGGEAGAHATESQQEAYNALTNAINLLKNVGRTARQQQIDEALAYYYNRRGTCGYSMGLYEQEVSDVTSALELNDLENGNHARIAQLYINRAEAYEELNKKNEAISSYESAIEHFEREQNEGGQNTERERADKLICIGRLYESLMKTPLALKAFLSAAQLYENMLSDDSPEIYDLAAHAHFMAGNMMCSILVRDLAACISQFTRSVELLDKIPDSLGKFRHLYSVLESRAGVYGMINEMERASADLARMKTLDHLISTGEEYNK